MADVNITQLDVVQAYGQKLKAFRTGALACGALIDHQIRKIERELGNKQSIVDSAVNTARNAKDQIVRRYKPLRAESLPGSECAGDTDQQISMKYALLEASITEYKSTIENIKSKMADIGQQTKTFCTILDSETLASSKRVADVITIMDQYKNS